MMKRIYYCDPDKNKDCKKTGCFKVGNTCCFTTCAKYQQLDVEKIEPVQALTALDYLNSAYGFHHAEPELVEEYNNLKDRAKPVKPVNCDGHETVDSCPRCGNHLYIGGAYRMKYCCDCGQAIDWDGVK